MAKAFYQYNDSVPADYAFTNETFNTAVRRYGGDDEIYLPEGCVHKKNQISQNDSIFNSCTDLTNIYWVAVGICAGIILLILLILLIAWRQKLELQYKK